MKIKKGRIGVNDWSVYTGDCLVIMDKLLENSIDCIITSVPYYNKRVYSKERNENTKADGNIAVWENNNVGNPIEGEIGAKCTKEKYLEDIKKFLEKSYRILKNNKFLFINISTYHDKKSLFDMSGDFVKLAEEVGFNSYEKAIWVKKNPSPAGKHKRIYLAQGWEYILIFTKGKEFKINSGEGVLNKNYIATYVGCYGRSESPIVKHSAPFPIEIPKYCLEIATQKGEVVLDPFVGAGNTLLAGLELDRNVIGIDILEKYTKPVGQYLDMLSIKD